jgi:hypothetical protein
MEAAEQEVRRQALPLRAPPKERHRHGLFSVSPGKSALLDHRRLAKILGTISKHLVDTRHAVIVNDTWEERVIARDQRVISGIVAAAAINNYDVGKRFGRQMQGRHPKCCLTKTGAQVSSRSTFCGDRE